jgi:cytochrome c5
LSSTTPAPAARSSRPTAWKTPTEANPKRSLSAMLAKHTRSAIASFSASRESSGRRSAVATCRACVDLPVAGAPWTTISGGG